MLSPMASFPKLDDVILEPFVQQAPRQMVADAVSLVLRGPSGICLVDSAMKIVTANQRLLDIFGYADITEISGMDFSLLMAPSERPTARKIHRRLDEGVITEIDGEWRGVTRRGETIMVSDISTVSIMSNGSRIRLSSIQDITRRRSDDPVNTLIGAAACDMRLMEIIAGDMSEALRTAQAALSELAAAPRKATDRILSKLDGSTDARAQSLAHRNAHQDDHSHQDDRAQQAEYAAQKPQIDEIERQIRKMQGILEHSRLSLGNGTYHRIAVNMQDMADEWSLDPTWHGYGVNNDISAPCLAMIDPGATKNCIDSILRAAQHHVALGGGARSDISISFDALFDEKDSNAAPSAVGSNNHADAVQRIGPHVSITVSNRKPSCNVEAVESSLSLTKPCCSNEAVASLSAQAASRLAAAHGGEARLVKFATGAVGLSILLPLTLL